MPPRRVKHGVVFVLTFAITSAIVAKVVLFILELRHPSWSRSKAQAWTPYRWWMSSDFLYEPGSNMPTTPPNPVNWLSEAPWPGQWPMPDLQSKSGQPGLLLKLHIFSMNTPRSRMRRDLIRSQDRLAAIPPVYRHMVELRFILGRCVIECDELEAEQAEHGDLFMLDMDENMDRGKTTMWLRSLNQEGMREALWVFKVDDDTLLYVQNLLEMLVRLDPTIPTYLGDPTGNWEKRFTYMQGGLYGLSYGIVRTIEAGNIPHEELTVHYPEDGRIGYFMAVLPPRPQTLQLPDPAPFPIHPPSRLSLPFGLDTMPDTSLVLRRRYPPPSKHRHQSHYPDGPLVSKPNRDSGLVRINLRGFLGHHWDPNRYDDHRQVAVHGIKDDDDFQGRWRRTQEQLKKYGRDVWKVPPVLEEYLSL